MLLIFLSWIYILSTTINFGVLTDKILGLKNKNFVIYSFLGLFAVTLLASIWAIFGRINAEFHAVLLISNFLIYYKWSNKIQETYRTFWKTLKTLSNGLQIYLFVVLLLILAQCSTLPYIIDNESYYIQTIKWLNEYGFVKGIANLHLYLGQNSGWHVAQSVFNFSFLYLNFNDLSGYCLLLGVLFSVEKLHFYFENKNLSYLVLGVFPLATIYFFQFISAPSPDIPVYVLTFIILFYFLENFKNCSSEMFNLSVILILFMLYIKSTSILFVLLLFPLFLQNFRVLRKGLLIPSFVAIFILLLFITKNIIVSGSILFPSKFDYAFAPDYSIPKTVESNYYDIIRYFGYNVNANQYRVMSIFELVQNWFMMPKLNGVFNKLSIILIFVVPFFIYKFCNKKSLWIVYILMVLQMLILFSTSPQYRFFMNFILYFLSFCFVCIVRNYKIITAALLFSLIPLIFILFIPIRLSYFTNNKFMSQSNTFSIKAILFPEENSKMKTDFEVLKIGNLKYYSPIENDFFYGTGNGPLPCVNKTQIEYYKKEFNVIPQMRTNDLKDGFYSKKLEAGVSNESIK